MAAQDLPDYAELHALSNFTFLRGASHPEELVHRAAELGYRALALTDECSLAGVVRAHVAARECPELELVVGTEIGLPDGPRLVLLATDRAAYGRLSTLVTHGRRAAEKGAYRLERTDLEAHDLSGCLVVGVFSYQPPRYFYFAMFPIAFGALTLVRRAIGDANWLRSWGD